MTTPRALKVGSLAPPFALHPADGRSLASLDGRGRPWVLAFARSWSADGESAGIAHPGRFTAEMTVRRCTACGERNLV